MPATNSTFFAGRSMDYRLKPLGDLHPADGLRSRSLRAPTPSRRQTMARRRRRPLVALVVSAYLAACTDGTRPTAPMRSDLFNGSSLSAESGQGRPRAIETIDDRFAKIATRITGFGGAFQGSDGYVYAYVTDPVSQAGDASTLRSLLPGGLGNKPTRLIRGQYSFAELRQWKNAAIALHTIRGVVFTDADETQNRLVVGVTDVAAATGVRAALGGLNIPDAAVLTIVGPAKNVLSTLQDDAQSPSRGALGITVAHPPNVGAHCTIGFVVWADSGIFGGQPLFERGARYAITNSHCGGTAYMGQTNATMYQYVSFPQNLIAYEIVDPAFLSSSQWNTQWGFTGLLCPSGRSCRFSDAAAYKLYSPTTFGTAAGTLARTLGPPTNSTSNSLQIDASSPTFTLSPYTYCSGGTCNTDDRITLVQGDTAYKTGSATGWTYGVVSRTCNDEAMFDLGVDLNKTLICQTDVQSRSSAGDSGSPVFTIRGGQAFAAGILWGSDGTEYGYSPLSMLVDLGDIGLIRFTPP